ncbi:MAG TPA: serine/threonine-protein kinase [Vicinamibacterales bacterium]
MLTEGALIDGRYEVTGLLAAGGMGEVYRARRVLLGDEVVIKVIRAGGQDAGDLRDRFMRESRTCAQLRHPNIVTILDFAIAEDGQPYLVMEYLNGRSLADELAALGPMSPAAVQEIVEPLCGALQLAHDSGIVHRDLKPANIVGHTFGSDQRVFKIIDFGLANIRAGGDTRMTRMDQFVGTLLYASPEQVQGLDVDGRCDIYSLGVVVFEMLTGRPPFQSANPMGLITKHLCEPPPVPSQVQPAVPAWLDAVVLEALAKDPADRHQTMSDFARALAGSRDAAVGGSSTPPPSALEAKYEIGPVINRGRLGSEVHSGTHRALGLPVAIRILRRGQRPDWEAVRERFLREARGLQVSHPSVIQVRDFGEEDGTLYLVTDLIVGESLLQVLDAEAPFEWPRVHGLGLQVMDAAAALHKRRVLLCGLNPGIIRMTTDEDGERLMISMGGIGQVQELLASLSDEAVRGGALAGNEMPYIAPEVLTGRAADVRSDIFTIGVLLYEMATGMLPYTGRTLPELLGAMLGGRAPRPTDACATVPDEASACLQRALDREPAARFATVDELRAVWRELPR